MAWTDEELDAAYDAYQGGSGGGWSDAELDAAWDAAQPPTLKETVDAESPWWGDAASGFLSGVAGLGDAADWLYQQTPYGQARKAHIRAQISPSLGDVLREGSDLATGVEGSTQINADSYAHKAGEYLPGMLMGPGKIAQGGATGTAANLGKILAGDAVLAGAGKAGEELGGPWGELASVLTVASLPTAARKIHGLIADIPTEQQALLQAFKIPDAKVGKATPALESIKAQGLIAPKGTTPFQSTAANLDDAITASRIQIAEKLEGTNTTISEIWPESKLFNKKVGAGVDTEAAVNALKTEQDALTKYALLKLEPPPAGVDPLIYGDELLSNYRGLEKAAKKTTAAAKELADLDKLIDEVQISGADLWSLRQGYDNNSSWNKLVDPKGKSQAYRAMRDAAQKKLLEIGGDDLAPLFDDFAAQMQSKKYVDKMAGAEQAGKTQAPALGQRIVDEVIKRPISRVLPGALGASPKAKPAQRLSQAFGPTGANRALQNLEPSLVAPSMALLGSRGETLENLSMPQDLQRSSVATSQSPTIEQSLSGNQSLKSIPSIQSDRDFIASKVDKAMDIEAPKIIQVTAAKSGKFGKANAVFQPETEQFIDKEEGGQRAKAYRPKVSGSGVTVATGVDLGNRTEYELKHLGLNTDLIEKLKPYLGKKDKLADAILERRPLRLSKAEASELDTAVKKDIKESVSKRLAKEGVKLTSLPVEAQTVVQSLAYNFGPALDNALPTIWKAIIAEDWARVQELLRSTKWKQPELKPRRLREAALLNKLVTA